jgi:hypothetical protein
MPGSGFSNYVVVYSVLREMMVQMWLFSFVDIGGIDDQHCLSFLFIANINKTNNPSALQV